MSWTIRAAILALACSGLAACSLEAGEHEGDEAEQALTAAGAACLLHTDCSAGMLCGFEPGTCGTVGGVCLPSTDAPGAVSPMAEPTSGCAVGSSPVCGCDGRDYVDACAAWQAGASVWLEGSCAQGAPPAAPTAGDGSCGGVMCQAGEFCFTEDGSCAADGSPSGTCRSLDGPCTSSAEPVCGCDGQTYDSLCAAVRSGASVVRRGSC